jgi:hypothetical protein
MIALLRHPFFLPVNALNTHLLFHLLVESERLMSCSWGRRLLVAALKVIISLCHRLPAWLENRRGRFATHTHRSWAILLFLRLDMRECIFKLIIIILLTFFFWMFCVVSWSIVINLFYWHYSWINISFFDIYDVIGRFIARIWSAWLRPLVFVVVLDRWFTERGMSQIRLVTTVWPHFWYYKVLFIQLWLFKKFNSGLIIYLIQTLKVKGVLGFWGDRKSVV